MRQLELYKGIFWYNPIENTLIEKKVRCDENGIALEVADYSSKSGENFNHRAEWAKLPREVTGGHPYNYYPRGRVEVRGGKVTVYLHPVLNTPQAYKLIGRSFGICVPAVRVVADGSAHYECLIDYQPNVRNLCGKVFDFFDNAENLCFDHDFCYGSHHDFKLLICGGRHFDNYDLLESAVEEILAKHELSYSGIEIVSGHCEGADQLGELFAEKHSIPTKVFKADWDAYGRAAGPIRNKEMVEYISSFPLSAVLAFVSEDSKGTGYTVRLAKKKNIPVVEIPVGKYQIKSVISAALRGEFGNYSQRDLMNTEEYKYLGCNIVDCPVCGRKTLDCYWICSGCGWEYDGTADENERSACNDSTIAEYREEYRKARDNHGS